MKYFWAQFPSVKSSRKNPRDPNELLDLPIVQAMYRAETCCLGGVMVKMAKCHGYDRCDVKSPFGGGTCCEHWRIRYYIYIYTNIYIYIYVTISI